MLVLSRKVGEEIVLPECGVRIVVVKSSSARTSLAIVAPPDVRILRKELCEDEFLRHIPISIETQNSVAHDSQKEVGDGTKTV